MRAAKDESEKKTLDDISTYGLHVVHVFEDEEHPRFAYTVGLFENYLHPEIVLIGLNEDLAHTLLNNMAFDIKNGTNYQANEFHEGVLDDFLCYFGNVPKSEYKDYVGWAIWFYEGYEFPLIQCVYPTVGGKFPWENDFPEDARFFCKMLIAAPKEH